MHSFALEARVVSGLFLFWTCFFALGVHPAPAESSDDLAEAERLIDLGEFQSARAVLQKALQGHPEDPEIHFFLGAVLNRTSNASEALEHFRQAAALNDRNPDLSFETGWALLESGQWKEAAARLESYEQLYPGRAQTQEFLGRAYFNLKEDDRARAAFDLAVRRDPRLAGVVAGYQAALARRAHDEKTIDRIFSALPEYSLNSLAAHTLRDHATGAGDKSPLSLELTLGAGYDTNPRGILGNAPQRTNLPSKPSGFVQGDLDARYRLSLAKSASITLGYQLQTLTHVRHNSFGDLVDQTLWAEYKQTFTPLSFSTRLWDDYSRLDDHNYRNQGGGRERLLIQLPHDVHLEASYELAYDRYQIHFGDDVFKGGALNRNGHSQIATLGAFYSPRETKMELQAGYTFEWNRTRGSDFDFNGEGFFVGFRAPLAWGFVGDAVFSYTYDKYRNINTVANPFARRRDRETRATLRLSKPISSKLTFIIDYDYNRELSNIGVYQYEQHLISSGLVLIW